MEKESKTINNKSKKRNEIKIKIISFQKKKEFIILD